MKGHEIINYIVREEVPNVEKVRENCHKMLDLRVEQQARSTVRFKRLATVAAAVVLLVTISTTALATMGGFDWFIQRFNPDFASVVEPVMVYAEDEGIRITVIGAQNFDNMAIVYLSVQEMTDESRLTRNMDWWPGLIIFVDAGGSGDQNLLYFDEVTRTAYLEVRINSDEILSDPLTLRVDRINFGEGRELVSILGNWELAVYTGDVASQNIVNMVYEVKLYDVLVTESFTLTPLGLSVTGRFGEPSSFVATDIINVVQREVYLETPSGLITLVGSVTSITSYGPLLDEEAMIAILEERHVADADSEEGFIFDRPPPTETIAELMELWETVRVDTSWSSKTPIDVAEVTAIIIDGQRILMP